MGATTWRGMRLMRISVSDWSTTEGDVDRSVAAILAAARAGRHHPLEVGPVLGAVEERLEHRDITATEKRHIVGRELVYDGAVCRGDVEVGCIREHVDRGGCPPQTNLPVAEKVREVR